MDKIRERSAYRQIIHDNIEYDILCQSYRAGSVEELVELMLDAICSTKPYQQINGEAVPTQVVKSRLLKVGYEHRPKPVRRKEIPKPYDPSKTRPLGIPCIWDRLGQQCVKQVLEPVCEAKFSKNSYGFRPNHSVENAIARSYQLLQHANLHYVIEFDVKGFFDNVNHAKLIRQIWAMGIHDKQLIFVIRRILRRVMLDTILTYSTTSALFIRVVGVVSILLSLVYSILLFKRKIKQKGKIARRKVLQIRLSRCMYSVSCIMAVAIQRRKIGHRRSEV